MKVAVMQPYLFPYIGYFQMINAVDTFVFYDDVNFIKGGWINRNQILVNKQPYMFTVSLENLSSFSLISESKIDLAKLERTKVKFLRTVDQSYKKAPFFQDVFPLVQSFYNETNETYISSMAINSVILVARYLGIDTKFKISSVDYSKTRGLGRLDRLLTIIEDVGASQYINPIGGIELYDKRDFAQQDVQLDFIKSKCVDYKQFNGEFVPWLSIIDVLMFNSPEEINSMLNQYELI